MGIESRPDVADVPADRIFTKAEPIAPPVATFTVSARGKPPNQPVFAYLRENYGNLRINEIDSLFGFVEKSTLYGGRKFVDRELSEKDVRDLNSAGIGVRLPMSNHVAERREYRMNQWLLGKYHVPGNSIICTNVNTTMGPRSWPRVRSRCRVSDMRTARTAAIGIVMSPASRRTATPAPNRVPRELARAPSTKASMMNRAAT